MPHTIVIFGASGDLTSRKLVPALCELYRKGRLPKETRIVGVSRTPMTDEQWQAKLAESTGQFLGGSLETSIWQSLAPMIRYLPGDVTRPEDVARMAPLLGEIEGQAETARVYYLATGPRFFEPAILALGAAGLADQSHGPRRVVIEKPFGMDLPTAQHLNETLHKVFVESQIFRIDHYLGKETVQNLLVFRFANSIFEPIWNRNFVDHVQITAAESVTVGHRAGFYDSVGVLRDMFQNHLLQLMALTAMESPNRTEAEAIRDEKVKVFRAVRAMQAEDAFRDTIRGQYRKYRDEPGVPPDSQTATFAVAKLFIDNWRWQGVPFLLRSGKAMACQTTQIVIQFRQPPHMMFEGGPRVAYESNRLVIQVQPAEGIQLHFYTKVPGIGMRLRQTDLSFLFREKFDSRIAEAYQRLLLDVMQGDASLFTRADEVELAWGIVDPILAAWNQPGWPPLALYEEGSWGPPSSTEWMCRQYREWFDSCPVIR